MKIVSILGILILSLIIGIVVRVLVKNRPKAEIITWSVLIIFWSIFLIYSLVLAIREDTPLFTNGQMANELFVICSAIFIVIGMILLSKSIKNLKSGKKKPS